MQEQKIKVLITGSAGFIGSHMREKFRKFDIDFVEYDLAYGQDIRNRFQLEKVFQNNFFTHVIHLAALAGVRNGENFPDEYISTNITGTFNVAQLCEKYGVEHLIFFSSSSVYGEGRPPIAESATKAPISLYGMTKRAGEGIVENARKIAHRTIIIPFTVYGENGRKDEVIFRWLEQYKAGQPITVYGDGSSCRGYVYVRDLVDTVYNIVIMKKDAWDLAYFNIGGQEVIRLSELVRIFKESIPDIKIKFKDRNALDVRDNFANTQSAFKYLGFDPPKNFEKNVKRIIKKYLYDEHR